MMVYVLYIAANGAPNTTLSAQFHQVLGSHSSILTKFAEPTLDFKNACQLVLLTGEKWQAE